MQRGKRRRVDWIVAAGEDPTHPRVAAPTLQSSGLAHLTSALLGNPSREIVDGVLREAVEFARDGIGLERAAIFLVGPDAQTMIGTWGTDAHGRTNDEHDLVFAVDDLVRQFFARAARGYPWTVYEDCPLFSHESGESRVLGRGALACTIIQGTHQPIGILYNDTALTGAPLDEAKQARAAVLCSLLGRTLDACREFLFDPDSKEAALRHPLVRRISGLLAADPSLSFADIARRLHMSQGHLTRTFKRQVGYSIVDYRNELRLARFLGRASDSALLEAAMGAGFGSYAQFHRVFRARFGTSPRVYCFENAERAVPGAK
jgi:AraC-like DNA-binding protein